MGSAALRWLQIDSAPTDSLVPADRPDGDREFLVPFSDLDAETQAEDFPLVVAIRTVARSVSGIAQAD